MNEAMGAKHRSFFLRCQALAAEFHHQHNQSGKDQTDTKECVSIELFTKDQNSQHCGSHRFGQG